MFDGLLRRLHGPTAPAEAGVAEVDSTRAPPIPAPLIATPAIDVQRLFYRHVAGDAAQDAAPEPGLATQVLEQLAGLAEALDVRRMPRLPALVPQLLGLLRSDDLDAGSVIRLLARDPTLAGDVVRVANTPFYRRSAAVTGLETAVGTLGSDGLRQVVLTSVMRPILRPQAAHMAARMADLLWLQSCARAWLCSRLAGGRWDTGEAHLGGIVAGVGGSALLRMVPAAVLARATLDDDFARGFDAIAWAFSARAAGHWHLSPALQQAMRDHATESAVAPLSTILRAADLLAMADMLGRDSGAAGRIDTVADLTDVPPPEQVALRAALHREMQSGAFA